MRVLFIGTDKSIITNPIGDARHRQLHYAKYFSKLNIIVFSLRKDNLVKTEFSNVIVIPTNSFSRWLYIIDSLKIISRLGKIDIISAQSPFVEAVVGVIAKLLWETKLNIQLHIDMFDTEYFRRESVQNLLFFWIAHVTLFFADSIRAGSRRLSKWPKAFLARVPVDNNFFWHKPRSITYWRVVTVGRLVPQKNIPLFIAVAKKLKIRFPQLNFVVVGDGPDRKKLEGPVNFVGWKNPAQYKEIFLKADIYLSTSNYEGWGMAMTEAIASGLPVVTTNTGCANELIINHKIGGIVCDTNNANELSSAVESLLLNPKLRRKLALTGQKILIQDFSPDKLTREFTEGLRNTFQASFLRNDDKTQRKEGVFKGQFSNNRIKRFKKKA